MSEPFTFGAVAPALAFVARLAELHPTLPAPHMTVSSIIAGRVSILLDGPAEIEAWREVLLVPAEALDSGVRHDGGLRMGFHSEVNGVQFDVFTHFDQAQPQEGAAA
jgi:hypothetical protein